MERRTKEQKEKGKEGKNLTRRGSHFPQATKGSTFFSEIVGRRGIWVLGMKQEMEWVWCLSQRDYNDRCDFRSWVCGEVYGRRFKRAFLYISVIPFQRGLWRRRSLTAYMNRVIRVGPPRFAFYFTASHFFPFNPPSISSFVNSIILRLTPQILTTTIKLGFILSSVYFFLFFLLI